MTQITTVIFPLSFSSQQALIPEDNTALFGPSLESAFGEQKIEGITTYISCMFTMRVCKESEPVLLVICVYACQ